MRPHRSSSSTAKASNQARLLPWWNSSRRSIARRASPSGLELCAPPREAFYIPKRLDPCNGNSLEENPLFTGDDSAYRRTKWTPAPITADQPRLRANGENACTTGMIDRRLMLRWRGNVQDQKIVSAMSSAVMGVVPSYGLDASSASPENRTSENSVSAKPGPMFVTRTFEPRRSALRFSANCFTNAFVAP